MIALVNAQATTWHARLPLSVMAIGAALEGRYPYEILDGNIDSALKESLFATIEREAIRYVAFTVMPGRQLTTSILLAKSLRERFPSILIIWGGYFPTLHPQVVLESGLVDFVVRDQGDVSFVNLIDALEQGHDLGSVKGISYLESGPRHNPKQELLDPNQLSSLPYRKVDVARYVERTYIGERTINYHSSVGCPFPCGFCAVAATYGARWRGLTAGRITDDLLMLQRQYQITAVEFHDNNFFTSEARTAEFSERIRGRGITWWGEGRPDTLLGYSDQSLQAMKDAGSVMIFFGAESSSQSVLDLMQKGGTQTPDTVLALADRLRRFGIVPEFSFVLGTPSDHLDADLETDMRYIRAIKTINPDAEIIIYVYSPVFFEEADLYRAAKVHSFAYPSRLEDWLLPEWQEHDLRKRPMAPWLSKRYIRRVKDFERVLNARFPTNSDLKLTRLQRRLLQTLGSWRYRFKLYEHPYEIATLQRLLRYRQPEIEGF